MPSIRRIGQVALSVEDLDGAIAFYRDTLGLAMQFRTPTMAFFSCGETRMIMGTENAHAQRTFLYFSVDDIHSAHDEMTRAGVAFDEAPHMVARLPDREVWLATFRDPAGTIHQLIGETMVAAGPTPSRSPSP